MTAPVGSRRSARRPLTPAPVGRDEHDPGTHSLQRQVNGSWAAPAVATKGVPNGYDTAEPEELVATTEPNAEAIVNEPMTPVVLEASGGTPTYEWTTGSTLPAGVTLSTGGELSGTPTETGAFPIIATVTDADGATDDVSFTLTVSEPLDITPIHEVQGEGTSSPEVGNEVSVEGVITALYLTGGKNGMYIQTAGTGGATDATPGASDAVFVDGGSSAANLPAGLAIGDSVQVTGTVAEDFGTTEIRSASATDVVELGAPLAPVTGLTIAYPTTEEAREDQEGMLLAPTDTFTVTNNFSTNNFGEVGLATGDVPLKQPTEFAAPDDTVAIDAIIAENLERAVILDDGANTNYLQNQTTKAVPLPWLTAGDGNPVASPPRVGAEATLVSPVILMKDFGAWRFQPRQQVTGNATYPGSNVATFEDTRAQNLTPQDVGGDISIATFNVLNFFNTTGEAYASAGPNQNPPLDTFCTYFTDRPEQPDRQQLLRRPQPGRPGHPGERGQQQQRQRAAWGRDPGEPGPPGAEARPHHQHPRRQRRRARGDGELHQAPGRDEPRRGAGLPDVPPQRGGPRCRDKWKYVKSPSEATNAGAVAEQDVIRNAFIYQPALVSPVGQSDILFGTTQFANAREPLAQAFKAAGAPNTDAFAVVVNHFKSKGDNGSPAPPASGDNTNSPLTGAFNGDRVRQATRLVEFANDFAASRDIEEIFLAGDFNSYTEEEPIHVLEAGGFELVESTDPNNPDEESYSFSGLSGSLDHVLANDAAQDLVTEADIWEINANESVAYQYSRYNYNATIFFNPNDPFATSDHNPEIVGLDLNDFTPSTPNKIQVLSTNDFHGRLLPDGGNAAGAAPFATAVAELEAELPAENTIFAAAGDLIGASTFESFVQNDEPTIDVLNAMDLDVSSAGNHEFDQGYEDFVGRVQASADWEYIATNIDEPVGRDDLAESWTTTVDGVDIGFVGAVTEDLPSLVNPAGMDRRPGAPDRRGRQPGSCRAQDRGHGHHRAAGPRGLALDRLHVVELHRRGNHLRQHRREHVGRRRRDRVRSHAPGVQLPLHGRRLGDRVACRDPASGGLRRSVRHQPQPAGVQLRHHLR